MRNGEGPTNNVNEVTNNLDACQQNDNSSKPRGDRYIRAAAVLVVIVLAGVAAYVSYHHQYGLAIKNGEPEETARWFPIVIDGVIVMASLVMLYCARLRLAVPRLAYLALWAGIGATLAANAAHGWDGGWISRLVSAAPAAVLVIAYELLMWLIRTIRHKAPEQTVERVVYRDREIEKVVEVEIPVIATDRFEAARLAYEASIEGGKRGLGRRTLADRWGLEIREAQEVIDEVKKERGQTPTDPEPPAPQQQPAEPLQPPFETASLNGSRPSPALNGESS